MKVVRPFPAGEPSPIHVPAEVVEAVRRISAARHKAGAPGAGRG